MAHSEIDADSALRDHFIASSVDLRQLFVNTGLRGGDEELARYAHEAWTPQIDALLDGNAYTFHRYELPSDHPMRNLGHPSDYLELGEDDVLRDMEAKRDFWRRRDPTLG